MKNNIVLILREYNFYKESPRGGGRGEDMMREGFNFCITLMTCISIQHIGCYCIKGS